MRKAILAAGAFVALSGCATYSDGYGYGQGAYNGYGYPTRAYAPSYGYNYGYPYQSYGYAYSPGYRGYYPPAVVVPSQPRYPGHEARREYRQDRREDRQEYRQERREDRREYRQERREDRAHAGPPPGSVNREIGREVRRALRERRGG